jgi:hypothetical protein
MSDLLDPPAVADWLGIPVRTLSQWRYLDRGPAYLVVGRHVRYSGADVEQWLGQQRRGGSDASRLTVS